MLADSKRVVDSRERREIGGAKACSRKKNAPFLLARWRFDRSITKPAHLLIGGLLLPVGPRDGIQMIRVPVHPSQPAIDVAAAFDRSILAEVRLGCVCSDAFRLTPLIDVICEPIELLLLLPPLPSFVLLLFDALIQLRSPLLLLAFASCSLITQAWKAIDESVDFVEEALDVLRVRDRHPAFATDFGHNRKRKTSRGVIGV